MSLDESREVFTPASLNLAVRTLLERQFGLVLIEGEISNLVRAASGHLYFSLKDASAQLRCAMFRQRAMYLRIRPQDGMQARVRARVSLYEPRGEFQIIVDHLEEAGAGRLRQAWEELRARLEAEGLFAAARKRALPPYPERIALITSSRGAAVHDVISVIRRRCPLVTLELIPVSVQGDKAAAEIRAALDWVSSAGRHALVILTRGGGSIEDLWSFNDEALVRAVAACAIPVIAAIGHETDLTLAELAADLRAATPSAAAELATPLLSEHLARAVQLHRRARIAIDRRLREAWQRIDSLERALRGLHPRQRLALLALRMGGARRRLLAVWHGRISELRRRSERAAIRLQAGNPMPRIALRRERLDARMIHWRRELLQAIAHRQGRLRALGAGLHGASPLATLERGFAIAMRPDGRLVTRATELAIGDALTVRLREGRVQTRVESTDPDDEKGTSS